MTDKVYKNDIGTAIILDTTEDISTQTTLKILYMKPSGTEGEWIATVYDTTKAKYVTTSGDLSEKGLWYLQVYLELPSWKGYGETVEMMVYDQWN